MSKIKNKNAKSETIILSKSHDKWVKMLSTKKDFDTRLPFDGSGNIRRAPGGYVLVSGPRK